MIRPILRPGQGFQRFEKLTDKTILVSGRPTKSGQMPDGYIDGILSESSPEEKERWSTTDHPVTHKIVQQGRNNIAKEGDILVLNDLYYYVQRKPRNPGGLNHFTVYFCEERSGLNG